MTEPTPTDRVRVAWELCEAERCMCECKLAKTRGACVLELAKAHRAIALGAKPPVDPVESAVEDIAPFVSLIVMRKSKPLGFVIAEDTAQEIVRHVLDRAKEVGL